MQLQYQTLAGNCCKKDRSSLATSLHRLVNSLQGVWRILPFLLYSFLSFYSCCTSLVYSRKFLSPFTFCFSCFLVCIDYIKLISYKLAFYRIRLALFWIIADAYFTTIKLQLIFLFASSMQMRKILRFLSRNYFHQY